jgi:hypothetical protein
LRTLIVKSACRSQSAPTSRAIGQCPVYFFRKFFKRPDCIVHGADSSGKVGLATGVAGVSFLRAFDEASEGPCVRGRGGLGLASAGLWLARGATVPAVGWALHGADLLRRGVHLPPARALR